MIKRISSVIGHKGTESKIEFTFKEASIARRMLQKNSESVLNRSVSSSVNFTTYEAVSTYVEPVDAIVINALVVPEALESRPSNFIIISKPTGGQTQVPSLT